VQNTKINYLVCQATYEAVELALGNNENVSPLITLSKHEASAQLVPAIKTLLENSHLRFEDLAFIAANQGPGPFTTLRVVLATVNGLNFASKIPLIGLDGLHAMMVENHMPGTITISLFNAFGQDAYFGIDDGVSQKTGWKNIGVLLTELRNTYRSSIRFIGSGALFFENEIKKVFGTDAIIPASLPLAPTMKVLGALAVAQFQRGENMSHQLLPLYLKQPTLENKTVKFV
jgi:tRNA threonylcarbamoyladenosine biosynthesis protein TsaB